MLRDRSSRLPASLKYIFFFGILVFVISCRSPNAGPLYQFITSGNWEDTANWLNGRYPGVVVRSPGRVFIASGVTCNLNSPLVNNGMIVIDGTLKSNNTLLNNDRITCDSQSTFIYYGQLTNAWKLIVARGASLLGNAGPSNLVNLTGDSIIIDGRMATGPGSHIMNQGVIADSSAVDCGGTIANIGTVFIAGAGAQQATFQFEDTVLNIGRFIASSGQVTGTGTFISYYSAVLTGYNGGPYIYRITSQPVNATCGTPCIGYFSVGSSGSGPSYLWQISYDFGKTWQVPTGPPFSNWNTATLKVTEPSERYTVAIYRCQLQGVGENNYGFSNSATFNLGAKK